MTELLRYLEAHGFACYIASGGDRDFMRPAAHLWSRVGRRPILAAGNSNGDIPMLRWSRGARPALRLLLVHDDAEREFADTAGAEDALQAAGAEGWTAVSMARDWSRVFPA
jgi:hypothetical protein